MSNLAVFFELCRPGVVHHRSRASLDRLQDFSRTVQHTGAQHRAEFRDLGEKTGGIAADHH